MANRVCGAFPLLQERNTVGLDVVHTATLATLPNRSDCRILTMRSSHIASSGALMEKYVLFCDWVGR